ncbi:MAG: SUMF1/EgtB/PvdO family nonheme iron enzyme [Planctomycetaceae bacterium]|nr:SUMF1/EgtB/PvdO family nonheme iron enzyme [Planctomycetaceae bacterium]
MPSTVPYRVGDEPVPGFRLLEFLGRGGFGEVWKASAPGGTELALKLIRLDDALGLKELRSLRLVKRLRHPNLVPIVAYWLKDHEGRLLDDDQVQGLGKGMSTVETERWQETPGHANNRLATPAELIIAMGLGESNLAQRLRECQAAGAAGLPREEVLTYIADAARAIDYLNRPVHELGAGPVAIQHCDIKPHNLLMVGGALQVCDFGLANILSDVRATSAAAGTIAYAAPECFREGKPSSATDQYSLAISYYELRTGVLPFDVQSQAHISRTVLEGELNFLRVPVAEQRILRRATALDPRQRFATCGELVQALAQAPADDPSDAATAILLPAPVDRKRPRALWLLPALLLLGAGVGLWQYLKASAPTLGDPAPRSAPRVGLTHEPLALKPGEPAPADESATNSAETPGSPESSQPEVVATSPAELTNTLGMKLVLIPAGTFLMGSDETPEQLAQALGPVAEGFNNDDERPAHRVELPNAFYLSAHEVTLADFRQFADAADYRTDAERDPRGGWGFAPAATSPAVGPQFTWREWGIAQAENSPVANVSWNDAQAFCAWLSEKEAVRYRLPTEAEWEYACRAGTTTRFSSGDSAADVARVANIASTERGTRPVGSYPANALGLFDMHGNVAEWCSDGYAKGFYSSAASQDPQGPAEAQFRVLRGGSWIHPPVRSRCAYRGFDKPEFRSGYLGFRVVREP